MKLTPKNWKSFQHYTDRKPAWIKLHRGLLDDYVFACLPVASRALAPLLWLLASEYENGEIPCGVEELSFRLHLPLSELIEALKPLINKGFFIADSDMLAACKQDAIPERERETQVQTEREGESRSLRSRAIVPFDDDWPEDFEDQFWKQYPRKIGRKAAIAKLNAIRKTREVSFAVILAGVARIPPGEPRFIPHATTWLNQGRWDDEPDKTLPFNGETNGSPSASQRAYAFAERAAEIELAAGFGRPPDGVGGGEAGGRSVGAIPKR